MCFSASASFSVSAILALISIACMTKVKQKKLFLFASIPSIFALQQLCEGIVWLTLTQQLHSVVLPYAAYAYLLFVFVVWPLWIPISLHRITHHPLLYVSGVSGLLISCAFLYASSYGVTAIMHNHHISYLFHPTQINVAYQWWVIIALLYINATVVPFFIVKDKRFWFFGTLLAIAYAVTGIFFSHAFISVWCFFTAVLSALIYAII